MIVGCHDEQYRCVEGVWLISKSVMKSHFAAPLSVGWGGERLNYMMPP